MSNFALAKGQQPHLRMSEKRYAGYRPSQIGIYIDRQNNGAIAQLVEQRTENPCVPGSIPGGTTEDR